MKTTASEKLKRPKRIVDIEGTNWLLPKPQYELTTKAPFVKDPKLLFDYWSGPLRAFDEPDPEKAATYCIYVYRQWPSIDNSMIGLEFSYEGKYQSWEFGEDCTDALEGFKKRHGSGQFGIQIHDLSVNNSGGKSRTIIETTYRLNDFGKYPPQLNLKCLNQLDPKNAMYIRWLKMRSIPIPGDPDFNKPEKDPDEVKMNAMAQKILENQLEKLDKQESVNGMQPLQDSVNMMAKTTADIVEKTTKQNESLMSKVLDMMSSAQGQKSADVGPIMAIMQTSFQSQLDSQRSTFQSMLDSRDRENQQLRDEVKRLTDKLEVAQRPAPQKTLLEQIEEMKRIESFLPKSRIIQKQEDDDSPPKWIQAFLPIVGQVAQSYMQSHTPQVPNMPQAQSSPQTASNGPQAQTTTSNASLATSAISDIAKAAMTAERAQQMISMYGAYLDTVAMPLFTHLSDPKLNGEDFADFFISGWGEMFYEQLKTVPVQDLVDAIIAHKGLGDSIHKANISLDRVKDFVERFLNADKYWKDSESESEDSDLEESDKTA